MFGDGDAQQWQHQQQMQAMLSMQGGMGTTMPSAGDAGVPNLPGIDPNMAQAYLAMFQQFSAQQAAQGALGMPPMPFPGAMPPMPSYNAPASQEPTVSVSVEGMKFQYQLTEDDIHKVFARYGDIKAIRVDEAGASAKITFANYNDGHSAVTDLNGKVLNGLDGTLKVQWSNGPQNMASPYPPMPFPPLPFGGMPFPPAAAAAPTDMGGGVGGDGKLVKGVRKYTCRFLIGIENDKDFQVARRIIGAKGANMKRVVKQTEAKLRLRGVGSGYFEGAGQKESTEPLQLCVSCTNGDHYASAIRQVEELLKRVYEEYKVFCRENGKEVPDLQINCSENQLVYSASRSAAGMPAALEEDDTPKKDQRNRRSRGKGGGGGSKAPAGDVERGEPGPNAPPVDDIEKMIEMRNEARRASNFAEADRIRQALHAQGVALMDEPGGRGRGTEVTTWRYWRD